MFDPSTYLTDTLAVVAQSWVEGFREYYGLDAAEPPEGIERGDWQVFKGLDRFAAKIAQASKSLERDEADIGETLRILKQEHGLDLAGDEFFRQALEAHFAEDLEDEVDKMSQRGLQLIRYLVRVRHERARAYLARVGACYLRGLEAETVLMCGAVLDAALQEEVEDEVVRASGVRCGKYVSMGNRIEYMINSCRLSGAEGVRFFAC